MGTIPNPKKCIELLIKSGCSKEIIKHSKAVRDLALKIAKMTDADLKLVEAGALLHDIGRSKTNGIYHGIEGVKIAKQLGLSDKIQKIIERHIGAGLSQEVAKNLGLPPREYIPKTLEEKIICHADNLIDNYKRKKIEYEIQRALKDGHKDYALQLNKLHNELCNICDFDLNNI
jgi:uncharacterized protein (TIGR00295 family)